MTQESKKKLEQLHTQVKSEKILAANKSAAKQVLLSLNLQLAKMSSQTVIGKRS